VTIKKKDRHHTNASFRNSGDTYWTWEITQEDWGDEKKEEGIMRPPANSGGAMIESLWWI